MTGAPEGLFEDEPSDEVILNVALIGPPKSGKSTGSFSAPGRILYLNAEGPSRLRYARRLYKGKADVVQVTSEAKMWAAVRLVAARDTEYKTVVLDTVGELYGALVKEMARGNSGAMKDKPKLDQYRDTGTLVRRVCDILVKLPHVHTVLLGHDMTFEDTEADEVEHLMHAGTSKPVLGRQIMGMVDLVGFTKMTRDDTGKPVPMATIAPRAGYNAGGYSCLAGGKSTTRKLDLTEWIETIKESENN